MEPLQNQTTASSPSPGLGLFSAEESSGEPSIPGSNRNLAKSAMCDSSSPYAARAWGSEDSGEDETPEGSTEDEDEDRRLVEAAAGQAQSPMTVGDSMTRKQVEHASFANKENRAPLKQDDTTHWTSNVTKWQLEDAENALTPRGKRNKKASGMKKKDSQALNDALSFAIQMDPINDHHATPTTVPAVLQPSKSLRSQAIRLMERSPLLHAQSSIANDPEWGPRALSEVRPDLKNEFISLCVLSYPVIFTYVLEFLPGIVSMTLVGHMDSPKTKEYVDGVSLSTMFMNLTGVAFGFGLATAMDTLCSQAYGAGKPKKMGIYFQCGVLVLGVTVIPVFLLNWYTEAFLLWMGQPEEVASLAGRFSRLVLPGIPFLYAYELFKKLLQAQNVVKPMVWIAVISNVVNVVAGVYLTWYTSLGYDGAAIARTISNVVLPMALVPYFMWHPEVVRQWWPGWKISQAIRHLKTFLTLGIPGMFMMLLEWWAFEIMAAFVGLLPDSVVAISVHSVLSNVSTMTFNFFLGIAVATNIRVGNYVGSNQPEHAKMASALGMVLSLVVSAALAVVILVTRNILPMVFINDPTSIALAAHAFLFLMPYQMLDAINSVMQGVFRGTGRQKLGAYINLFGYFAVGLPFGVFLAFNWNYGVEGLWLGLTAGIGIGVLMSMYKIYKIDWDEMADAARVRTS